MRFKSSASVIATNEEEGTHIPSVLENSKQPLRSYQIGGISLPQKLGEVITQAHFLPSATFLHYGVNGDVSLCIESKSPLVDKATGGYHVELQADVNSGYNKVPVYSICMTITMIKKLKILKGN